MITIRFSHRRMACGAAALLMTMLMVGCASPQSRIERNPEAFERLPPEQQELVRAGRVAIGFDENAVKLALGKPDRVTERTDPDGKSTIWRYVESDGGYGGSFYSSFGPGFYGPYGRGFGYYGPFYGPFYGPYYGAGFGGFYPGNFGGGRGYEVDRLRVVFGDGKVTAIEEELR